MRRISKILNKHKYINFYFHNYFPVPQKSFVINLASNNKKIIQKSFQHIKKAIRLCKTFKLKFLVFILVFYMIQIQSFLVKK